jgi:hypothetical protein
VDTLGDRKEKGEMPIFEAIESGLDISLSYTIDDLADEIEQWNEDEIDLKGYRSKPRDIPSLPPAKRSEKVDPGRSKLEGLDLSPINVGPYHRSRFSVRPNVVRKPVAEEPVNSSMDDRLRLIKRFLPYSFLILAILAYIYVVFRVVIDLDLPQFMVISIDQGQLFLVLCILLILTVLSNMVWRYYLKRKWRMNGGSSKEVVN